MRVRYRRNTLQFSERDTQGDSVRQYAECGATSQETAHAIRKRLMVEFSNASSTLEGNTYDAIESQMKYQRQTKPKLIDGYTQWLKQALEADSRRPRKECRTALKLTQLQA